MLFELDESILDINPISNKQIRAIENLLGAYQNRDHLIFSSMKTLRELNAKISESLSYPSRAMLSELHNSAVEHRDFVKTIDYKVIVFIDAEKSRICRVGNIWHVSLDYLSESGLLQSAIIGENEIDAEFFLIFGELYRRKQSIKKFGTKARLKGGGGSGIPVAIEKYLDSESSPCLSISDSDKFHPSDEISSTVKKCVRIKGERNNIFEFLFLEEREIENFIPKKIIEKVINLDGLLSACDGTILRNEKLWPYLDLKDGVTLRWIRSKDQRTRDFWKQLHEKLERKRSGCFSCDSDRTILDDSCGCSGIKGLGAGLLEKCVGYLKTNSVPQTLKLLNEDVAWEKIAKIVFDFSVIPLGERALA